VREQSSLAVEIAKASSQTAPIVVIHGAEGRGKTTLASKFPRPLFLLLERGLPTSITVDEIANLETYDQVLAAFKEIYVARDDFQTLVVDTIDQLEALIIKHVCSENRWLNIEAPSFGKGYVAVENEWRKILRALNAIRIVRKMTVVLVGHSDIARIDDPRTATFTSYQLRLHRRSRALVMDAADLVGFLSEDIKLIVSGEGFHERTRAAASSTRYLFVEGRPAYAAKNRFNMPEKIEIPRDFNIQNLSKFWTNSSGEHHG
jgi:hypothetical protein